MNTRSMFLSALLAGAAMGLLGSLPLLNLVNCCLCIWIWIGGGLAAWLYRRYEADGPGLSGAQAAGLGALAGLFGAGIGFVVFLLTSFISTPIFASLAQALEIEGVMPAQNAGFMGLLSQATIFLVIDLVLYPLFGALGSLIAAQLLWKKTSS